MQLDWSSPPREPITVAAGPRTDLFVDPAGGEPVLNAPMLLGATENDFLLSARVRADLRATFDAGALMLHAGERASTTSATKRALSPTRAAAPEQPYVVIPVN